MTTYREFAPTVFDAAGLSLPDRQDWHVAPCTQNRDSDSTTQSNFAACLALLGGESDTVEVHSFNHWACGWFEVILVHPERGAEVDAIAERLEDYPLLDEDDASDREWQSFVDSWNSWACREFAQTVVREFGLQELAEDMLLDAPADTVLTWYMAHAPYPYEGDAIRIAANVDRLSRDQIADLLRFCRGMR